jgi:ribulose-5-phosphate 4-epimerase/fuculose-1-phosphate aldolase
MDQEGYIKFNCTWIECELIASDELHSLRFWREILYDHNLIGSYPDGTGFGNISKRLEKNIFLVSGTATGHIPNLTEQHFSLVTTFDIKKNALTCEGPVKASSESLTHAVIYESVPWVNAIVHIHNRTLWDKLIDIMPTTSAEVEYGTPEIALEIKRLLKTTSLEQEKIIAMGGHKEGIISFGAELGEAVNNILVLLS